MIIDGNKIATEIYDNLKHRVALLPHKPVLCDVVIGSDPVTMSFVRAKQKWSEFVGLSFLIKHLPDNITQAEAEQTVREAQDNPDLCGLIVQLPLPPSLDKQSILDCINENVDVDGLSSKAQAKFYQSEHHLVPPTAGAVWQILKGLNLDLKNEQILIVGQGALVGKPVARLLELDGLSFKVADKTISDLPSLVQASSIIISGVGQAGLITGDMLADGAVVIDAGTSESGGTIKGDVDIGTQLDKLRYITPVPGGVGPVTVARLLMNVIEVSEKRWINS